MKNLHMLNICLFGVIFIFLSSFANAKEIFYRPEGDHIRKAVKEDGKFTVEELCKGRIDLKPLNIDEGTIDLVDVSSDERYFVFAGAFARKYDRQWFLMDMDECRVVRELTFDRQAYASFYYRVAFSPDSTKLYITWEIVSRKKGVDVPKYLTIEYSGTAFEQERVLKNVFIPMKFGTSGKPYRFSRDGKLILVHRMSPQWYYNLAVYDIQRDEEVLKIDDIREYFGNNVPLMGQEDENEYVPYIFNGQLLFNLKKDSGSEINIFDYKEKKIKKKIPVSDKGIGRFSSKGDKIVFTEFPDPKTKKKKAILFETATGKQIGQTVLDESDELIEVGADDKEIIIKHGEERRKIKIK